MLQATSTSSHILSKFPIFESVQPQEMERLQRMAVLKTVERGTDIYKSGQDADKIYFLVKGSIKMSTILPDGREVVKQILYPLAMFGEQCLTSESKRTEYAASVSDDTQFFVINTTDFHQLMRDDYTLTRKILDILGRRLAAAQEKFESLIHKDARTRIIDFLKDSANNMGRPIGYETLLKHSLTQQDIASLTGTSRQTVTSVLNELRKSDKIYFNRKSILIRDLANLN